MLNKKNTETILYLELIHGHDNRTKMRGSQNTKEKEFTNKLSKSLSASQSKVIQYVNCLIKRRIMSSSAISSITLKYVNREI